MVAVVAAEDTAAETVDMAAETVVVAVDTAIEAEVIETHSNQY
jgi:hypothetical protein